MEIINRVLEARLPKSDDPWMKTFTEQSIFLCSQIRQAYEPFVVCFCERENLLNQWRVYAGTTGYSIGFESKALTTAGDQVGLLYDKGFDLMKVIYVRADQERLTAAVIDAIVDAIRPLSSQQDAALGRVAPGIAVEALASVLGQLCMCFKDPAFADEHEWRLCHQVPTAFMHHLREQNKRGTTLVQCRSGSRGLIPYAVLDARVEWGTQKGEWYIDVKDKRLPIMEVWHGPSMHPENSKFALKRLLFQWGYGDVPVKGSAIPLRP